MNANELLKGIRVASPCRARWQDMTGDERSRFCHQCCRHVYNISAMPADEAVELIRAHEGKLCGRFYRRRDGTVLTADCPVGAEKLSRRLKALAATAVTLLLTSLGVKGWNGGSVTGERGPFAEKCGYLVWTVKGWLKLNPEPLMGAVCVSPMPAPQPAQATGDPANPAAGKP
jgi:hypothetical protein